MVVPTFMPPLPKAHSSTRQENKMPGYLSNRLIAFIPAEKATVDATIEIIQGDIDDLSLNLGV
jgi:hypothetical protein